MISIISPAHSSFELLTVEKIGCIGPSFRRSRKSRRENTKVCLGIKFDTRSLVLARLLEFEGERDHRMNNHGATRVSRCSASRAALHLSKLRIVEESLTMVRVQLIDTRIHYHSKVE